MTVTAPLGWFIAVLGSCDSNKLDSLSCVVVVALTEWIIDYLWFMSPHQNGQRVVPGCCRSSRKDHLICLVHVAQIKRAIYRA